ncbi:hypothetical protein L1049_019090 [Liquidambar formosana]|uniref:Uncharacterized protein n=1 Tax=Liquidambar formosana TaxID=63359 RepID=A0AAP0RC05_LIQFO
MPVQRKGDPNRQADKYWGAEVGKNRTSQRKTGLQEMSAPEIESEVNETRIVPPTGSESDLPPPGAERVIYKFFFSKPYFVAFSFLITILVGVLQVHNQNNNASPFHTHPANMWAFIIATSIYSFAFAATSRLPPDTSRSLLAGFVAFFSGALSVVSIVWMFVPLWLAWLITILWFLLLGMVACDLFLPFFQRLFSWLMGSNAMDQQSTGQPSLPV